MANTERLEASDYVVVGGYFLLVLLTGIWAMRRSNRSTVSGYFLAGRFMTWLPVGASIFASNIGSEHFIGLAGSGAASGLGVGAFELNALLILQLCSWVFLPVFIASKVNTLPGYMSKRFGGVRIQTYLAILSMLLYVFTKISVNLFSGAIFIQQTIGWDLYWSIGILLAVTSVCTVTGGLTAVMYTETVQSIIMIGGSGILSVMAIREIGGFGELFPKYLAAIPRSIPANRTECAVPKANSFQMLRSLDDPDIPWLGFVLGQTPASIWYWCADQMMVQRLLAAKSLSHAQGGTIVAGYLKILPLILIIVPGMISRILYTDEVACVDPDVCFQYCKSRVSCTNTAYPRLVLGLLPSPLKGLIMSVMFAALMSDLSSVFNSASTLFTCDIWPRLRPRSSIRELMIVGRFFVIVMIVVSIVWVPIIEQMQGGQMYLYIQNIAANLAPPIAAVYILAILSRRINESGAFWALIAGLVVGVARLGANLVYSEPLCGEADERPLLIKLHYMYFAIILFWFTVAVCALVSWCSTPPHPESLARTTFWTRYDETPRADEVIQELDDAVTFTNSDFSLHEQNCWDWFCGLKNDEDGESENPDKSLKSIQQDSCTRMWLFLCTFKIVCVGIGLYVFLSLPNWWKMHFLV